jgi:Calx-beta domain
MRSSAGVSKARVSRGVVGIALIGATLAVASPARAAANTISVGDATVVEGNTGPKGRTVSIPVWLSQPGTGSTVTVAYTLVGTGSATAGSDYMQKSGTLKFALNRNGVTPVTRQVNVAIMGDTTTGEGDETFEVHLSNPQGGGGFSLGRDVGIATIRDDDPSSGVQMSIGDTSVPEGDSVNRMRNAKFMVTLSEPSTVPVTVQWNVASDTAYCAKIVYNSPTQPGQDCQTFATPKTLRFAVGRTGFTMVSKIVNVGIVPDTVSEGDQTFHITLTTLTGAGASLADDTGVGIILDDDPPLG